MKVAIIPARGGSKRIPRKNIKLFAGKPMLAWSIEAAQASGCFNHIIVSTDDSEIADVARAYGAEVPFIRPLELSDDHTGTIPVVAHAVDWTFKQIGHVSFACCLCATAPFIRVQDLCYGLDLLHASGAQYAFTVTNFAAPIQRSFRITANQRIEMFDPSQFDTRSQDLEVAYHDAGQFYWGHAQAWLAETPLFWQASVPIVLPRYRVQDIDTQDDWLRAELLFNTLNQSEERTI